MGFVVTIVSTAEKLLEAQRQWLPMVGRILLTLTFLEDAFRLATDFTAQAELLTGKENMVTLPYPVAVGFVSVCFCFQLLGGLLILINALVPFAASLLLMFLWSSILVYGVGLPDEIHHSGMLIYIVRVLALIGALLMLIADNWRTKQEKELLKSSGTSPGSLCTDGSSWTRWLQFAGRFLLAIQCFQIIELINRGAVENSTDQTMHHYSGIRIVDPTPQFEKFPRFDAVWNAVPNQDAGVESAHSGECQEICAADPNCFLYTWRANAGGKCILSSEREFDAVADPNKWQHVSTTVSGIKLRFNTEGGKIAVANIVKQSGYAKWPSTATLHKCYKLCELNPDCFIFTWYNTPKNDDWSRKCITVSKDNAVKGAITDPSSWVDGDEHLSSILGYCIVACALSVGVLIGFQTKTAGLLIAFILIIVNTMYNGFWTATHADHWDYLQYYFFQNISIFGGLLILVSVGPGGFSFDEKKRD